MGMAERKSLMRIALVHPHSWPEVRRGGERYLDDLAWYLHGAGHEVHVLTGTDGPSRESTEHGVLFQRIHHLHHPIVERRGVSSDDTFGAEPRGPRSTNRWLRRAWPVTLICMLLFYGAGFYHLVLGIPGLGFTGHTELVPVEWRDFGRQIDGITDAVRSRYGDDLLVVGMDRYAIASERAFYSHDRSRSVAETSSSHLFGGMGLMYEWWFPAQRQTGRTLLLLGWDAGDLAEAHLQSHVSGLEPLQEGTLVRDGRAVRRYYYRVVHGYR